MPGLAPLSEQRAAGTSTSSALAIIEQNAFLAVRFHEYLVLGQKSNRYRRRFPPRHKLPTHGPGRSVESLWVESLWEDVRATSRDAKRLELDFDFVFREGQFSARFFDDVGSLRALDGDVR